MQELNNEKRMTALVEGEAGILSVKRLGGLNGWHVCGGWEERVYQRVCYGDYQISSTIPQLQGLIFIVINKSNEVPCCH